MNRPAFILPETATKAGMTLPVTRAVPIAEWHLHRAVLQDLHRDSIPAAFVAISGDPRSERGLVEVWREPARRRDRLADYRANQD